MYSNTAINKTSEAVINYLNDLDDNELVNIHNTYCREQNYSDDEIYINDEEFFNTFFDGKVLEAVRAVCFGEYNYQDDFVRFNGYANLESFNSPTDKVDISAIAEDILENPENYDIELNEVFLLDGTYYEGAEDDVKEEYETYKEEIETENEDIEDEDDKEEILSFEAWVKQNIAEA